MLKGKRDNDMYNQADAGNVCAIDTLKTRRPCFNK